MHEMDEHGFSLCARCGASAYSAEICKDVACPLTLVVKRMALLDFEQYWAEKVETFLTMKDAARATWLKAKGL